MEASLSNGFSVHLPQNLGGAIQAAVLLDETEPDNVLSQVFVLVGIEGGGGNGAQLVVPDEPLAEPEVERIPGVFAFLHDFLGYRRRQL